MKYATGDNIPQVAIQPSASPVSANVLPAAGQPIRGANELMQIAEAMAPFNQGLMAFGKRVVDVDNENAAMLGSQLNFNGVSSAETDPARRAADLNKQFKDVVASSGASDAANPYFQLAARQNFGRKLGLDYRSAVYQMKEQVTDPDKPISYAEASARALEQVVGSSLDGDFYGFQGFKEVAQKTDAEMMARFNEEAVQRKETQGALNAKAAISAAVANGDLATADMALADYQTKVTDPAKVRANFIGTAKDSIMSATTLEDLHKRVDVLRDMRYGNQQVHNNMDLLGEITQYSEEATRRILAKTEQDTKLNEIAFENGKRSLYANGFVTDALHQIQTNGQEIAGGSYQDWVERTVDNVAQKEKWSPYVTERVKQHAFDMMQSMLAKSTTMADSKSKAAAKEVLGQIMDGRLKTESEVMDACGTSGVHAEDIPGLIDLSTRRSGPVRAALDQTVEQMTQQNIGILSNAYNANGAMPFGVDGKPSATSLIETQKHSMQVAQELYDATNEFISGKVPDARGNYFESYQKQGQQQAATAVRRFLADKNSDLLKAKIDESDRMVAAGKKSVNGSWVAAKNPTDLSDSNWRSTGTLGDLAKRVNEGKVSVNIDKPPAEIAQVYGDTIRRLSHDYEVGWFSTGTVDQLRTTIAYQLFRNYGLEPGKTVRTAKREVWGGLLGAITAIPDYLLTEYTSGWTSAAFNAFSTYKTSDELREDYASVMRLHGMTLDHILMDKDQEGLPVFGLTLPRDRQELLKAAFAVPMIQSLDELRDTAKVSAVLQRLGLTDAEAPQFIQAQRTLFHLRNIGLSQGGNASVSITTQDELNQAKSEYYLHLEEAKKKLNTP